ncbi:non-ribosomal peptide synthetase/type I polyketide synthase [Vibrio spartinae]|uniref:Chondramide synthase cmdD n=1 Tax=Vibrio spartinae TaxID=1918945 RepID=A0ABX6QYM3_9VIBR|nr:non-ribosomal peptide synthetase/type I polyketide synthase [Vibrio spartinae]QMV14111.1 Chondramide synthase cmdD [Vibrio spartinae]
MGISSGTRKTIIDILYERANKKDSNHFGFEYEANDRQSVTRLSFAALHGQACSIARHLKHGAISGRVLLWFPPGLSFHRAFYGCLYAGITAVPMSVPPIHPENHQRSVRRTQRTRHIIQAADACGILTTSALRGQLAYLQQLIPEIAALPIFFEEELTDDITAAANWQPERIHPDHLAYIQFTSGSTGEPKGAMITHENIVQQGIGHAEVFPVPQGASSVVWLPFTHDWGLIDGVIMPVINGHQCYAISPASFLQRPYRWLQAISDKRAYISGGPNFAYDLCIERIRIEQLQSLDLSEWRIAQSGAETVRPATLSDFARKFAEAGFCYESFRPAYGMAESVLVATGYHQNNVSPVALNFERDALNQNRAEVTGQSSDTVPLTSCGMPISSLSLKIVDPETKISLGSGQIGEVWMAGPSLAKGYYNQPDATDETFNAYLASGEGPMMRTGDLGFLHQGHFYMTGRRKELIIIAGQNHYPQDIETTVFEAVSGLRKNGGAAFVHHIDSQGEVLIIVQEIQSIRAVPDLETVVSAVTAAVAEVHGIKLEALILVRPRTLPVTTSGKIERRTCCQLYLNDELQEVARWSRCDASDLDPDGRAAEQHHRVDAARLRRWLAQAISQQTGVVQNTISDRQAFSDFGLDSRDLGSLSGALEQWLGRELSATIFYEYPTVGALVSAMTSSGTSLAQKNISGTVGQHVAEPVAARDGIAVVGMSCRFPGATTPEAFWTQCLQSGNQFETIPVSRFDAGQYLQVVSQKEALSPQTIYMDKGAFIRDVEQFDAGLFGISGREAVSMDPQQRLLLELSWQALEDAGIAPDSLSDSNTGVYIGLSNNDYQKILADSERVGPWGATGNATSVAAGRLSYTLGLRGPAMVVDTACSSALVAVHLACQALRNGEADVALVGAANLLLTPDLFQSFCAAQMLSLSGKNRSFVAGADGYIRGEGGAVLVLKPLAQAKVDGDRVLGVLRGSAVNHDGHSNGLTAPSQQAQIELIRRAQNDAGVSPQAISYIEAHGTGTALGDPIELEALETVFHGRKQRLAVGSVKSQIGHLEAAAGMAGLLKALMVARHGIIPPHPEAGQPTPIFPWDTASLMLPETEQQIEAEQRFVGVSAFGLSGTNAHIIVENIGIENAVAAESLPAEVPTEERTGNGPYLLPISAADPRALDQLKAHYLSWMESASDTVLPDLCFSAMTTRSQFPYRLSAFGSDLAGMCHSLERASLPESAVANEPEVIFLFSGQGSSAFAGVRELYTQFSGIRQIFDTGEQLAKRHGIPSLLTILFGEDEQRSVQETQWMQPALFLIEYAVAKQWQYWGVEPSLCIGHSLGELVAACICGAMSFADGLALVIARGQLMQTHAPIGEMTVFFADSDTVTTLIRDIDDLQIAARNAPQNTVVSGTPMALESVRNRADEQQIAYRKLPVTRAFHTEQMQQAADELAAYVTDLTFRPLQTAMMTVSDGRHVAVGELISADYWHQQLLAPVDFYPSVQQLVEDESRWFIEVGSGAALLSFISGMSSSAGKRCIASVSGNRGCATSLMKGLGQIWQTGVAIDWTAVLPEGKKVALPGYPFQRQRYWPISTDLAQPTETIRETDGLTSQSDGDTESLTTSQQTLDWLRHTVADILLIDVQRVETQRALVPQGLDSLMAIRLIDRVKAQCGYILPIADVLGGGTLAGLTEKIQSHISLTESTVSEDVSVTGESESGSLSSSQLRLWMLDQLSPGNPAYNLPTSIRLSGPLSVRILEQCLTTIQQRHAVLRTSFLSGLDSEPKAVVNPVEPLSLPVTTLAAENQEEALARFAAEEAAFPFDLFRAPLFRASLVHLSDTEHVLFLTFHHIIADGWSLGGILMPELGELYRVMSAGQTSSLEQTITPGMKITYLAHAERQQQMMGDESFAAQREYWQMQLADLPPVVTLPPSRRRPLTRGYQGCRRHWVMPEELAAGLKVLSHHHGVTLFMTMLAGLNVVLQRWTDQHDIVIGTTFSERDSTSVAVFGDFTNFLPLRIQLDAQQTVASLLASVHQTCLDAFTNGHFPFDKIVAAVNPLRQSEQHPLFAVSFVLHSFDARTRPVEMTDELTARFIPPLIQIDNNTSEADLIIEAAHGPDGLILECEYDTELYDAALIDCFLQQYQTLLGFLVESSQTTPVAQLPVVEAGTLPGLIGARLQASRGESHQTIIERFDEITRHAPDHIAIRDLAGADSWSYQAVAKASERLARHLVLHGIGPESRVGLALNPSARLIICMLAVMRVGGTYVPFDTRWPERRQQFVTQDAGLDLILHDLTQARDADCPVLAVGPELLQGPAGPSVVLPTVNGKSAAYVIYTSGSTGMPKGVLISHENVLRLLDCSVALFDFNNRDIWLMAHSAAFDFSVWEIWGALLNGGTLVTADPETIRDPAAVHRLLHEEKVTVFNQTPSAFRAFSREHLSRQSHLSDLRLIIFGGEALDLQMLEPWIEIYGDQQPRLCNMYGITETTVHNTFHFIGRDELNTLGVIGMPLADRELYLLDESLYPVPHGIVGEIYIGGGGLAQGYLGRPALTAERFVPHPFSPEPGERLYRSGDLGRYLPDGKLIYVGRADHQVKIRGFRIEIDEIRMVLNQYPQVIDSVVLAEQDHDDTALIAYVVPEPTSSGQSEAIDGWRHVFDETYASQHDLGPEMLNISGWHSSYDGHPIPAEEMKEWVDQTVLRIQALKPKRVLEMGCGTGMILLRLAPDCHDYTGMDISATALEYIAGVLSRNRFDHEQITLQQGAADDFSSIAPSSVDTVILNSVVQLFPSIDYLEQVIAGALSRLSPQGTLFIGDVRHYGLHALFHLSVLDFQNKAVGSDLAERLVSRCQEDKELLVAPDYFYQLKQRYPQIRQVEVRLKTTWGENEMSRFRFDVVIQCGPALSAPVKCDWLPCPEDQHALRTMLSQSQKTLFGVRNIPNQRLHRWVRMMARAELNGSGEADLYCDQQAFHPAEIVEMAASLNWTAQILWTGNNADGCFDAVFIQRDRTSDPEQVVIQNLVADHGGTAAWQTQANVPDLGLVSQQQIAEMRRHLEAHLPSYMIPELVPVAGLPLSGNGKIDTARLKQLRRQRVVSSETFVAPQDALQEAIAEEWREVLDLTKIGVKDNFFELGGHSLKATQLVARLQERFSIDVPLSAIFTAPTIEEQHSIILEQLTRLAQETEYDSDDISLRDVSMR